MNLVVDPDFLEAYGISPDLVKDETGELLSDVLDTIRATAKAFYVLRGKPVTKDQAAQIIAKLESLFQPWGMVESEKMNGELDLPETYPWDGITCSNFIIDVFSGWKLCQTWVHEDGTIGSNSALSYQASVYEVVEDLLQLAEHFPYLEFVMLVAGYDLMSSVKAHLKGKTYSGDVPMYATAWDVDLMSMNESEYLQNCVYGMSLKNQQIRIMKGDTAVAEYKKFSQKYVQRPFSFYSAKEAYVYDASYTLFKRICEIRGVKDMAIELKWEEIQESLAHQHTKKIEEIMSRSCLNV